MKKKNLKHSGLSLNKKVVSSLSTEDLKGGTRTTISINFLDANTNCGAQTGLCLTALNCPYSIACPPTEICFP